MIYVILFFLGFSLLLYVLLAGADFGAGIVELFSSKKNQVITKKKIYQVMGPVWEANHIWIIILIVILWVGFPAYYNILVVYLHIPLTLTLLGITLRGVAFVFRHYDAYKDKSQVVYDRIFKLASLVTPIFLGMTFGAMIGGSIKTTEEYVTNGFVELFIAPWFNVFSLLIGFFFAALCSFLSATLLIGEANKGDAQIYIKKSRIATIVVVILGFVALTYGYLTDVKFVTLFVGNPISVVSIAISGIIIAPLLLSIKSGRKIASRFFAGLQVLLILFAALVAHFPNYLITETGQISLLETAAPSSTISTLAITLIVGGAVILPGLFHLLKSFKMIKILER